MKASELIEKLAELINTYGDCECWYHSNNTDYVEDFDTVYEDSGDFLISHKGEV